MLLVNHTLKMVEEGMLAVDDYKYRIVQFYRYNRAAHLKGAEKHGRMLVEFAAVLRVEFIPEGGASGPVKDIYLKITRRARVASWAPFWDGPP